MLRRKLRQKVGRLIMNTSEPIKNDTKQENLLLPKKYVDNSELSLLSASRRIQELLLQLILIEYKLNLQRHWRKRQ